VPIEVPRARETAEISVIVGTFRLAALNAIEAGFDGVEVQGANSHLIEEFLEDRTNQRTDAYGGSKENACDFCWRSSNKSRLRLDRIE
jgi:N-ethylmaleimide reductase